MPGRMRRMRKPRVPGKRRRVARAPRARARGGKKAGLNPSNQYATIVETIEFSPVKSNQPIQYTFNLSQFFRATTLAKNFQFYKAAKVKWEYMPLYNVFQQSNSVGVVARPQMYFMMNRDQDPYWETRTPAIALFSIQASGADPRPFTKNFELVYKPNWCSPGLSAYTLGASQTLTSLTQLGMKKQFSWLPTPNKDAYGVPTTINLIQNPIPAGQTMAPTANAAAVYNGHNMFIEQDNAIDTDIAKVVCTVEWHFKLGKSNYVADPTSVEVPAEIPQV